MTDYADRTNRFTWIKKISASAILAIPLINIVAEFALRYFGGHSLAELQPQQHRPGKKLCETLTENRHLGWDTYPTLPSEKIDEHFTKVDDSITQRYRGATFLDLPNWKPNRPKDEVLKEFYALNEWRLNAWFKDHKAIPCEAHPDFMTAPELLQSGNYRSSNCIAFQYNCTDPSYNCSSLIYQGQRFFALEGPMKHNLSDFFRVLTVNRVKHLVRVTVDREGSSIKCEAYWKNKISKDSFLKIPMPGQPWNYPNNVPYALVKYTFLEKWADRSAVDVKLLLSTIKEVQNNDKDDKDIIAVHCSAGVGRTGTFIAAYCIIKEIDKLRKTNSLDQLNIGKIVSSINLQRKWMVGEPAQYFALYQLADYYINSLT